MFKNDDIDESKIDPSLLYFHGSNNGKITKFRPPSPERPLFVTADIDYANAYLDAVSVNGRSKFNEDKDPGKVYMMSLNPDKINLFNATKQSDIDKLEGVWPKYIIDSISKKEWSIWSIFKWIVPFLHKYYCDFDKDPRKLKAYLEKEQVKDEFGISELVFGIEEIDVMYGDKLEPVFKQNKGKDSKEAEWDELFFIIKIFNMSLVELGFNAFLNIEHVGNTKTDKAIGLFSPDCLDSLTPTPLDGETVKKIINDLDKSLELKDYSTLKKMRTVYKKSKSA